MSCYASCMVLSVWFDVQALQTSTNFAAEPSKPQSHIVLILQTPQMQQTQLPPLRSAVRTKDSLWSLEGGIGMMLFAEHFEGGGLWHALLCWAVHLSRST